MKRPKIKIKWLLCKRHFFCSRHYRLFQCIDNSHNQLIINISVHHQYCSVYHQYFNSSSIFQFIINIVQCIINNTVYHQYFSLSSIFQSIINVTILTYLINCRSPVMRHLWKGTYPRNQGRHRNPLKGHTSLRKITLKRQNYKNEGNRYKKEGKVETKTMSK